MSKKKSKKYGKRLARFLLGGLIVLFLSTVFLGGILFSNFRHKEEAVEPKIKPLKTSVPTTTATPTTTPTPVPVKETANTTNCDELIGKLMGQYNNLYKVDDILLSSNKECHYHLLRENNLVVNDGHIRDQLQEQPDSPGGTLGSKSSSSDSNTGNNIQSSSGLTYYSLGSGHWVSKNIDGGEYIKLEDGSLWEISPLDKIDTILWLTLDDITVTESSNLLYPYLLVNTDDNETAEAKLITK